jgi:ribose 5-phosphate isomerase B
MDTEPLPAIAIGCDHAGPALKRALADALRAAGHDVLDMGTHDDGRVDYPDIAHAVCAAVEEGRAQRGVLVCGSGVGMAIAANRHPGIRCAVASETTTARLCREHNDANVIALGARLIDEATARDILRVFLGAAFEGGRHVQRLGKLLPHKADDGKPLAVQGATV